MSDSEERWIPDEEVNACSVCHRDFSVTFRRHHCRSCGKVVCSDCSLHRVELKKPGQKDRVCDTCEVRFTEDGTGIADELKAKTQMSLALKSALKEKQCDIDRIRAVTMQLVDGTVGDVDPAVLQARALYVVREKVSDCIQAQEDLKRERQALVEAEGRARALARKTLHAEAEGRRIGSLEWEIHNLEDTSEKQDVLIDQLRERVTRLETEDVARDARPVPIARSADPRVSLLVEGQRESIVSGSSCARSVKKCCSSFCTIN